MSDRRLAEYALGTLTPTETAEVETLLNSSAEARSELRSLRASLVRLTEALPPVQPPAQLWDALVAQLPASPETLPVPVTALPRRTPLQSYLGWALAACLGVVALTQTLGVNSAQRAYREVQREAYLVADFLATPGAEKIALRGRERESVGSVLTRPGGAALFVLGEAPPEGRSYQAWGHTSNDWEPGSEVRLTSLGVSDDPIFEVATGTFAALYVSLEPVGGSPQPTYALSRVSLGEPVVSAPLSVTTPADGSVISGDSVIVTGLVDASVANLSYVLNGTSKQTTTAGSRFSFTATLQRGVNTLIVRAEGPQGVTTETLTLLRP